MVNFEFEHRLFQVSARWFSKDTASFRIQRERFRNAARSREI